MTATAPSQRGPRRDPLNLRVATLFSAAGFHTVPAPESVYTEHEIPQRGRNARTVDLLAVDSTLGIRIIGENTTTARFNESFSTIVNDLAKLMSDDSAGAGLLVFTRYRPRKEDIEYASQQRIQVWDKSRLEYYESIVDAVGGFAKYEIIHSFGLRTREERDTHTALAIRVKQPTTRNDVELYIFSTSPDFLLKTCAVYRRAEGNAAAYQRILKASRLDSVHRFVTRPDALLPPAIIIHMGQRVTWRSMEIPSTGSDGQSIVCSREADYQLGVLSIPREYSSLELLDGQHRLFGFVGSEPATLASFNLLVVGIKGLSAKRKSQTFVAINDNARRMDANLVTFLKHTDDEEACQSDPELMAIRIAVLLSEQPPFQDRIRLLDAGESHITLKGFAGYDLKGLVSKRGKLRKYYENSSAEYVKALRLYFNVLKSTFPDAWRDPNIYIIFTNRGISAFLKLLKSILKNIDRQLTADDCHKYFDVLEEKFETWETEFLKKNYTASQGWKEFHRDLVSAIRKKYRTFQE